MDFINMDWVNIIITLVSSLGLGSLGGMWYAKRRAKAEVSQVEAQTDQVQIDVVKSVQEVYNRTIDRLQQDRDEANERTKDLQTKIADMEREISDLRHKVSNNEKKLAFLLPITCCVKDCKDRILFVDDDSILKKNVRKRNEVRIKRNIDTQNQGV